MTQEYQNAIGLTLGQKKAFDSLKKAITQCKKANILFYQNLESLGALNGNKVERITDKITDPDVSDEACLQYLLFPVVKTECSWADDDHYVILKTK